MTSLIHIQGTLTEDSAVRARHTLRDRGDELLAELAAKIALATDLQLPLAQREEVRDGLIALCTSRVVRHRLATDQVLYAVAAGSAETRQLVRALRAHDTCTHAKPRRSSLWTARSRLVRGPAQPYRGRSTDPPARES